MTDQDAVQAWIDGDDDPTGLAAAGRTLATRDGARRLARELHFAYALRVATRARLDTGRRTPSLRLVRSRRRPAPRGAWTAAALAAGLVLAVAGWAMLRTGPAIAPPPVRILGAGTVVTLAAGDRIEVGSGRLEVGTDDRWWLVQGSVRVAAAPRPATAPLRIDLPGAEAVVVGTRFLLEADAMAVGVTVDEGAVRCATRAGNEVIVRAGGVWTLRDGRVRHEERLLAHAFTGETLERFTGRPVAGPGTDGRPSLPGVLVNGTAQEWGVYLSDWDRGLIEVRGGERLRCDLWIAADAPAPLLRIEMQAGGPYRGRVLDLPRGRWVPIDLALADLPVLDGPDTPIPADSRLGDLALLMPAAGSPDLRIADLRLVRIHEGP